MPVLDLRLDGDGAWPDLVPDGRTVLAETSLRLFLAAAKAFVARYGDQ